MDTISAISAISATSAIRAIGLSTPPDWFVPRSTGVVPGLATAFRFDLARRMPRTRAAAAPLDSPAATPQPFPWVNEVRLVGRLSALPDPRELPSGDVVVLLRLVVTRPPTQRKQQVDTIDVACWTPMTRRAAARLNADDVVEVDGALRRRFYKAGAVTQSRYEVEAVRVRRHRGAT